MIKFNYVENIARLYDTDDGWYINFANNKFNVYFSECNIYTQYNEYVLKDTTDTLEEALEIVDNIISSFDHDCNYELAYDIQYTHINTQQV